MDLKQLEKLIDLFEKKEISELEYEKEGVKVKMKKGGESAPAFISSHVGHAVPHPVAHHPESAKDEGAGKKTGLDPNLATVESPIVGTFYRSPSPEAPPYVDVGNTVEKGQVLCIVEAMKVMNEIESEVRGKIVSILAENAQPVEYGEPLFQVEPL